MRPGTPGFVGDRLKEAREARGLTQISLAELVGVTAQAVSQYESGLASPRPDVLAKLPTILNVQVGFFLERPPPDEERRPIFWRSQSSATAAARVKSARKLGWLKRIVDYFAQFVRLPFVNFPHWDFSTNVMEITNEEIEDAAARLRVHWNLSNGPISNVVYLLENQGAVMSRLSLGAATLDAFSQVRPHEERPYIVLGSDKASAARSRWDAAHELGHLILHREIGPDVLRKSPEFAMMEAQAHYFAGAFLLPADTFADDFIAPTLDSLMSLKLKWNVSMAAMLMRAKHLGLLSEEHEARFWRAYARKGYKRGEPLDNETPQEQPEISRQTISLLINEKIQSPVQIRQALPFGPSDVEELTGLPRGALSETPRVTMLEPNESPKVRDSDIGVVLKFRKRQ